MIRASGRLLLVWTICSFGVVSTASAASAYVAPKNTFGQPDFQGIWNSSTITRLERDPRYGASLVMPPEEVMRIEGEVQEGNKAANRPTAADAKVQDVNASCEIPGFRVGVACGYNNGWVDQGDTVMRVNGQPRTSFITSTPNGRLPPYQPGKSAPTRRGASSDESGPAGESDNPEDRSLGERCLLSFGNGSGPVMMPRLYNNNYQIFQTEDEVAILVEMVHDVRHVPLNRRQHLPTNVRPWMGDSIGRWEGDTLVIETTNFPVAQASSFYGASPDLKVTERLTRTSANRLHYKFLVEDPITWQQPWSGEYEFSSASGPVYEYACHEGNYGLEGILAGARAEEAAKQTPSAQGAAAR